MNIDKKREFIERHCNELRDYAIERVEAMPDSWDGLELREYLADLFDKERFMQENRARKTEYRTRIRDYMSECINRFL